MGQANPGIGRLQRGQSLTLPIDGFGITADPEPEVTKIVFAISLVQRFQTNYQPRVFGDRDRFEQFKRDAMRFPHLRVDSPKRFLTAVESERRSANIGRALAE